MRWTSLKGLAILPLLVVPTRAADRPLETLLPSNAQILETKDISTIAGKPRTLVLWMTGAVKVHDRDEYCGTSVYGDYWRGNAKLSVIDSSAQHVVNTLGLGDVDLPFYVKGYYYHIDRPDQAHKGKPDILHLSDLTGEGRAAQFRIFEYEACGIAAARIYGYRPQTDRAVAYDVEVRERNHTHREQNIDNVFDRDPVKPGYWDITWKPGHGSDDTYHDIVHFDAKRQIFVDRHVTIKGRF